MMIFLLALSGLYPVASITALRMQLCKLCGKMHRAMLTARRERWPSRKILYAHSPAKLGT
jgi:hypothetical protein